jgi:DNA polymerase-3 subunit epsilon/CBS domain-containing protein
VFLDILIDQQLDDLEHGRPPTNAVLVQRLGTAERRELRSALEQVRHLDALTRDLLFGA